MAVSAGSPTVSDVKGKLQGVLAELEKYRDLYRTTNQELEIGKDTRAKQEAEIISLNRQLTDAGRECEQLNVKLQLTSEKHQEALKAADESERARRTMDHRRAIDEDRITVLETMLRETSEAATECERKYEEVTRKLLQTESELEKAEAKCETADQKSKNLQQDMHAVTTKLKSVTAAVEKYKQREEKYSKVLEDLNSRLKMSESHSHESERTVLKLQAELDRVQDELARVKRLYQSLHQELLPGYPHEISTM